MRLAATPSLGRVTVLYGTEFGVRAYDRASLGVWTPTLVGLAQGDTDVGGWAYGLLREGFDSYGHLHLLLRDNGSQGTLQDAHEQ